MPGSFKDIHPPSSPSGRCRGTTGACSRWNRPNSPPGPHISSNDLVRTAFRAPDSSIVKSSIFADNDDCLRLIADGNAALGKIRSDRGLGGQGGPAAVLTRTLQEVTFRAEYEYDYGMRPWVARIDHLLSPLHLERLFLGRHKYAHFRVWYRDALSKYVQEMLLDPRTLSRPYLERTCSRSHCERPPQGRPELHYRDSQGVDPGTHSPPAPEHLEV